jgi:hypothetical protein
MIRNGARRSFEDLTGAFAPYASAIEAVVQSKQLSPAARLALAQTAMSPPSLQSDMAQAVWIKLADGDVASSLLKALGLMGEPHRASARQNLVTSCCSLEAKEHSG